MHNLIEFLRSISVVVLFIFLEIIAIIAYAISTPYTEAKILGSVAGAVSAINTITRGVHGYIELGGENRVLMERVVALEQQLAAHEESAQDSLLVAQSLEASAASPYSYIAAKVMYNSVNKLRNKIVLNRGLLDGVRERQALVSLSGEMVGYIVACTDHYSVGCSVLSLDFHSSGQIEDMPHVGSLYWNGESRYHLQMRELSKYAEPTIGAELYSTSFSQIFPAGVKIGRISSFEMDATGVSYNLNIELAADISAQQNLFIVGNNNLESVEYVLNQYE